MWMWMLNLAHAAPIEVSAAPPPATDWAAGQRTGIAPVGWIGGSELVAVRWVYGQSDGGDPIPVAELIRSAHPNASIPLGCAAPGADPGRWTIGPCDPAGFDLDRVDARAIAKLDPALQAIDPAAVYRETLARWGVEPQAVALSPLPLELGGHTLSAESARGEGDVVLLSVAWDGAAAALPLQRWSYKLADVLAATPPSGGPLTLIWRGGTCCVTGEQNVGITLAPVPLPGAVP